MCFVFTEQSGARQRRKQLLKACDEVKDENKYLNANRQDVNSLTNKTITKQDIIDCLVLLNSESSHCLQYPRQNPCQIHASNESMKKHILIYESTEVGLKYSLNLILISELFA